MRHPLFVFILFCLVFLASLPKGLAQEVERVDISLDSLLQLPITAAAKHWQTIGEAPASVSIITSSDINRFGYRTLEEVLMSVRGFYVSNDRNYTYVGVRGFSRPTDYNNRVLLLLNGHTLNENVYGSSPLGTDLGFTLDMIDKIEIVRGPSSSLYGTSAMFTVINIITKKGSTLDGFLASATAGSHGRLQGSVLWGKEFASGLDVFVAAHATDIKGEDLYFREFDTDSTNHGVAQDLDWDRYSSVLATLSLQNVKLQAALTTREKGIPTASFGTLFNDASARSLDERRMIEMKWNPLLSSDKELLLRGYYDFYHYDGTYPYDVRFNDASDDVWLGSELQFRWDITSNNRTIVGMEYQRHTRSDYRYEYQGQMLFNRNVPFSITSLYLQNEYQPTEVLSLTVGLRHDSYSTFGSSTNPRGAIIYNPMKNSALKLLYGSAFRAPNFYEVYYEDFSGAKENPQLKPETIRTAEAIWEQRLSEALFGIVSVYDYRMENLIDQQIDETDSLAQFQNVSRVKARGLELELNFRFQNELRGYLSYILQNAEDTGSGVRLTNSPQHIAKAGISYPLLRPLEVAVEFLYETERKTVYNTQTDAYFLTNLNVSSPRLFDLMKFSLLVKNVFDVDYKLPGGLEHVQHAIVQPGRTFTVRAELRL